MEFVAMSKTWTQHMPLYVILTYDGNYMYVDGEPAMMLLGMASGSVFIATATRRLAVTQQDFDLAQHQGTSYASEVSVKDALRGRTIWSHGIEEYE